MQEMMETSTTDILDNLTGFEIFEAGNKCDEAIDAYFMEHVKRVKNALNLEDSYWEPRRRTHHDDSGDLVIASRSYILYDSLKPVLIGTVMREHNHSLLSIVDRSGATPVLYEKCFDTRDFVEKDAICTADQLAKKLLPDAGEFTLNHVAAALENMTQWRLEHKHPARLELADVIREVREMNMSYESKDAIVEALQKAPFACEWVLPNFDNQAAGFRVV